MPRGLLFADDQPRRQTFQQRQPAVQVDAAEIAGVAASDEIVILMDDDYGFFQERVGLFAVAERRRAAAQDVFEIIAQVVGRGPGHPGLDAEVAVIG
jgi:hypothetical protein